MFATLDIGSSRFQVRLFNKRLDRGGTTGNDFGFDVSVPVSGPVGTTPKVTSLPSAAACAPLLIAT
jgi:hypothetical protein